jgi:glycosyltransferase involved in cell wall biosynthesis
MRLAIIASHPIQYQAPLFRHLALKADLVVFFGHAATPADQAAAGFEVAFDWDTELLSGYSHIFLRNVAAQPSVNTFKGCDTPEIGKRLAEDHFDAVLLMGWYRKSFIQALLASKRLGLPVLVRGDSQLNTPRGFAKQVAKSISYPALLRLFDVGLYVGERSREYWTHYRYPVSRLFFSPHCVDGEWFAVRATREARTALRARLGVVQNAKLALFAGKLVSFKRPLDLVAAAAQLRGRGRNIEVLVAGAGPLQQEMFNAAVAVGVPCHLLGFCNQSQMPAVYAAADVLVLPSDGRETWGLVANEALACRRPIVVSDAVGAAPDLAADGTVGRTYPMGNVAALAVALDDVLINPPTVEALEARSARYSIAAAAEGILDAIGFAARRSLQIQLAS